MRFTYITHSCVLIEINGKKILTDPWLTGPCWGNNIWHYPPPKKNPEDFDDIDFLFISHAHDDHLHPESLAKMTAKSKSVPCLVPDFGASYFETELRRNGLNNLVFLEEKDDFFIDAETKVKVIKNDLGDHDSSLLIQSERMNVFLQTDNLMSLEEATRIGKNYDIGMVFNLTLLTGIFPAFFDFKPDTLKRLSSEKTEKAYDYSIELLKRLGVKYSVPYASDLSYFGHLFFANSLHRGDKNDFKNKASIEVPDVEVLTMGPDDYFEINDKGVLSNLTLGDHDHAAKDLSSYFVSIRKEHEKKMIEEKKYQDEGLEDDLNLFVRVIKNHLHKWKSGSYRVIWKIVDLAGREYVYHHDMQDKEIEVNTKKIGIELTEIDLLIELPSYRLQRLIKGDYFMGMLTLQNGSIRCYRNDESFSENEKKFWKWSQQLRFVDV
tara:strand:+ start:6845 stop:8152 length:1308 start_codon:yes stop_codon:yes gene_type:complete